MVSWQALDLRGEPAVLTVAGPHWNGELPKGITKIIKSETDLVIAIYRTQLFNPGNIDNVKKIQEKYKVQTLSSFLGLPAPPANPPLKFITPLTPETEKTSIQFYNVLNYILNLCPTDSSEIGLMERFAKINVGAGKIIDTTTLSPEEKAAFHRGIADAWAEFEKFKIDTYSR